MRKNLLAVVLLVVILFNLYIPQIAFSFIPENKQKAFVSPQISNGFEQLPLVKNDTSKILIKRSEIISPEKQFKYNVTPLSHHVSFDLTPISKRKFSVSFLNKNHTRVAVKIYDIIGNLIIEENVTGKGYFYKEYDLTFYNSDLFIIEVGNSKYNKTKSLVAG